jgi:hypothetical protein
MSYNFPSLIPIRNALERKQIVQDEYYFILRESSPNFRLRQKIDLSC